MNKPEKLDTLMYALMKEARRTSLMDFIHNWGISTKEYEEIEKWFEDELKINL
ncbi:hypothetical protein [Bacillus infantis]|uniref:hypothetical protein n=1 Tax=Bacillus infantis TaxID=324767 RepID=UPI003CEB9370